MDKTIKQSTAKPSSPRPPVVAILGHVDHGKTTLLDAIRKTNVAAREHGGITQAIGAYQITFNTKEGEGKITFIDTPGHEAFTKMRSRGVAACDIAILVVAADDGVMPQTKEAIVHIREAKTPFIVALTKADLEAANPEKVKQQLLKEGIALEGLGGGADSAPTVSVSAKTGKGISDLLELIVLVAQMANISGLPREAFEGVIIEAKRDSRRGVTTTIIVRNGSLAVGDQIVAEQISGKVRALFTDTGEKIAEALPGTPVEVLGFSDVPKVGAKVISAQASTAIQQQVQKAPIQAVDAEPQKRLGIILKADTQGSLEALLQSLPKEDIHILLSVTGDPTEADVLLAKTTNALVIGFNTKISPSVAKLAETEGVLIKTYKLIYELLSELEDAAAAFKEGKMPEVILGKAKIIALFPYEGKKVAGCKVLEGRVAKGDKVRVERGGEVLGESRITSLRQGKEDVNKVESPLECGILLSAPLDFEPSDVILSVR